LASIAKAAKAIGYTPLEKDGMNNILKVGMKGVTRQKSNFGFIVSVLQSHLDAPLFNVIPQEHSLVIRPSPKQVWNEIIIPTDDIGFTVVNYNLINDIPFYSFSSVINNLVPEEAFANKIVLVGTSSSILHDVHYVSSGKRLPGVSILACALLSSLRGDHITELSFNFQVIIFILLTALFFFLTKKRKSAVIIVAFVAFSLFWFVISCFLFYAYSFRLPQVTLFSLLFCLSALRLYEIRFRSIVGLSKVSDEFVFVEAERSLRLGKKLFERGDIEQSLKYFQKAANLETALQDTGNFYVALVMLKKGDRDTATGIVQQIDFDQIPDDKSYLLAESFEESGRLETAQKIYSQMYSKNTEYKDVSERLQSIRQQLSHFNEEDVATMIAQRIIDMRYRETRMIGHGGMGFVFSALDSNADDRQVAIKVLSPFYANNKDVYNRFIREAKGISEFTHPNVIKIYDVFEANLPYFAMEFLDGWTEMNDMLVAKGFFEPSFVTKIINQVSNGLSTMHKNGITHRDIKPHNIMINDKGDAKLIDFGIAKFDNLTAMTATGDTMGTPLYMSPEQVKGCELGFRSDIYSLGVVVYQALTGECPFKVMTEHITTPLPPFPANSNLPVKTFEVLNKAMAKDPAKRYHSIKDFASELAASF